MVTIVGAGPLRSLQIQHSSMSRVIMSIWARLAASATRVACRRYVSAGSVERCGVEGTRTAAGQGWDGAEVVDFVGFFDSLEQADGAVDEPMISYIRSSKSNIIYGKGSIITG